MHRTSLRSRLAIWDAAEGCVRSTILIVFMLAHMCTSELIAAKSKKPIYTMAKIDKISISLFMFAIESYLLEKKVIQNIKQLDWKIVEKYRNRLLIDHPHFKLDKKQMKSFIKHYNDRLHKLQKRRDPVDLDPLKDLLREYDAAHVPGSEVALRATTLGTAEVSLLMSEISEMRSMLMSEIAEMRSLLMSEIAEMRSTFRLLANPPQAASHRQAEESIPIASFDRSRPSIADVKAILQSLDSFSPRPFIRARQRVALLVLWISGRNVSQLLTLEVRHLKQLREFAGREGCDAQELVADLLEDEPLGLAQDLEMLIGDYPDSTPAFRSKPHSARPSTRPGFTNELNHILSKWKYSTKSLAPSG